MNEKQNVTHSALVKVDTLGSAATVILRISEALGTLHSVMRANNVPGDAMLRIRLEAGELLFELLWLKEVSE